jgi:rubredoxin
VHAHGLEREAAYAQTGTPRPRRWLVLPSARGLETEVPRAGQNSGLPIDRACDIIRGELRGGDPRPMAATMCTTPDPLTLWWKCRECGYLFQADTLPEACPSRTAECVFVDASSYTPECKGRSRGTPIEGSGLRPRQRRYRGAAGSEAMSGVREGGDREKGGRRSSGASPLGQVDDDGVYDRP